VSELHACAVWHSQSASIQATFMRRTAPGKDIVGNWAFATISPSRFAYSSYWYVVTG